jgi:putative hydrolase of the HAD superfamily
MKVLVFDAMGVIYSVGDDVQYLLCPFIAEKGGTRDEALVNRLYNEATLGAISPAEFWKAVGLTLEMEDEYLLRHNLTNGVLDFLERMKSRNVPVWLLSNDVSEWSRKLRTRFRLEPYFHGFVVSGDLRVRKPDRAIYHTLIERSGANPRDMLYVDDSRKNLDAAAALGFHTALFSPTGDPSAPDPNPYPHTIFPAPSPVNHQIVRAFDELLVFMT